MATVPMKLAHTVDEARFWIWVEKGEGCWEWQGADGGAGYGLWHVGGRTIGAHRASWAIANGRDIPPGMHIDHMCHNTMCVNPGHLRLATPKQNAENYLPVRAASGYRGVYQKGDRWYVRVRHNRRLHSRGGFDTAEEANRVAIALRNELYTHNILDRVASDDV